MCAVFLRLNNDFVDSSQTTVKVTVDIVCLKKLHIIRFGYGIFFRVVLLCVLRR